MKEFKDKVAVITGAANGIGFGIAERCAQLGMRVVLAGINADNLGSTVFNGKSILNHKGHKGHEGNTPDKCSLQNLCVRSVLRV